MEHSAALPPCFPMLFTNTNTATLSSGMRADSCLMWLLACSAGVHDPGFACLLDTSSATFTLLAPRVPPEAAVWWGGLPSLEECAAAAGADRWAQGAAAVHQQQQRLVRCQLTISSLASNHQSSSNDVRLAQAHCQYGRRGQLCVLCWHQIG